VEAVEFCRRVDEIDTTGKTAPQVAELVARIIKDELELPPGQVDWLIRFLWLEGLTVLVQFKY